MFLGTRESVYTWGRGQNFPFRLPPRSLQMCSGTLIQKSSLQRFSPMNMQYFFYDNYKSISIG